MKIVKEAFHKAKPWASAAGLSAIVQQTWHSGLHRVADPNSSVTQAMQVASEYGDLATMGLASMAIWKAASVIDKRLPDYMSGAGQAVTYLATLAGMNAAGSYVPEDGLASVSGIADTMWQQAQFSAQELRDYLPGPDTVEHKAPAVSMQYLGLACATTKYAIHMGAHIVGSMLKDAQQSQPELDAQMQPREPPKKYHSNISGSIGQQRKKKRAA